MGAEAPEDCFPRVSVLQKNNIAAGCSARLAFGLKCLVLVRSIVVKGGGAGRRVFEEVWFGPEGVAESFREAQSGDDRSSSAADRRRRSWRN